MNTLTHSLSQAMHIALVHSEMLFPFEVAPAHITLERPCITVRIGDVLIEMPTFVGCVFAARHLASELLFAARLHLRHLLPPRALVPAVSLELPHRKGAVCTVRTSPDWLIRLIG